MCFTAAKHDPPPQGLQFLKDSPSGQPLFLDEDCNRVFEITDYSENQEERSKQCHAAKIRDRKDYQEIRELEIEPLGDAIRAASPFWADITPTGIRKGF